MKKVIVFFELLDGLTAEEIRDKHEKLVGFQEIKRHMIFDVNMDLIRQTRYVAGGGILQQRQQALLIQAWYLVTAFVLLSYLLVYMV